ncbi:zf-CCHC domain-containing protein, partial [Tanacetum coccineum]
PDDQPNSPHLKHEQDRSVAHDRPRRNSKAPSQFSFEDYAAYALQVAEEVETLEPTTYREAITSKESDMWSAAMGEEIEYLHKNKTWELAPSGSLIYLLLYVDDMLAAAKDIEEVNKLKILLNTEFDMKDLGVAQNILGNSQVKDNKIDLLVQQYEQFVISEDESIDSAFAIFNTIVTSLKALDEESKDLTSLSLDELIGNLKVHDMIIKKDYEIVKAKAERKSLALKAKKESYDEESSTSRSEDEKYAMAVREFKKFFKRRGSGEEDDEKAKDQMCLMAQAFSVVHSEPSYFSDENSSVDDIILDSEYNKLCKMSLKIITKNKHLKAIRNSLGNEINRLKEKLFKLERNKEVDLECTMCQTLKIDNKNSKRKLSS